MRKQVNRNDPSSVYLSERNSLLRAALRADPGIKLSQEDSFSTDQEESPLYDEIDRPFDPSVFLCTPKPKKHRSSSEIISPSIPKTEKSLVSPPRLSISPILIDLEFEDQIAPSLSPDQSREKKVENKASLLSIDPLTDQVHSDELLSTIQDPLYTTPTSPIEIEDSIDQEEKPKSRKTQQSPQQTGLPFQLLQTVQSRSNSFSLFRSSPRPLPASPISEPSETNKKTTTKPQDQNEK